MGLALLVVLVVLTASLPPPVTTAGATSVGVDIASTLAAELAVAV